MIKLFFLPFFCFYNEVSASLYPFIAFSCLEKVLRKLERNQENTSKFRRELQMAISRKIESDRLENENRTKKERVKLR